MLLARNTEYGEGTLADIEITAYADDCLVRANLALPEGVRMSDHLNDVETLALAKVQLLSLEDGHIVRLETLDLATDDILAIEAPAATTSGSHKIRTRTSRIEVEVGPYRVLGHLHGPTTGDPFAALTRRKGMIPITESTIAFNLAGRARMRDVDVVIVNRLRASLVQRVVHEPDELDDFGILSVDPHAKDLTHELSAGIREPEAYL